MLEYFSSIVIVRIERVLVDAHLTLDTTIRVSFYYELGRQISLHLVPSLFPDGDSFFSQIFLGLTDRIIAIVKNTGGKDSVRLAYKQSLI